MEEDNLLSTEQNHSLKRDPIWKYGTEGLNDKGNKVITCVYCQKTFAGGGVNRLKHHLGKVKGNVAACTKVLPEVCSLVVALLRDNARKSKEKKADFEIENDDQEIPKVINETSTKGKRKSDHGIEAYMSGKTKKFVVLDEEDDSVVGICSSSFFEDDGNEDPYDDSCFGEPRVLIGNEYE
ncbi:OLC1v1024392C1 [Oldenlandia corymbosa var. corymbosa]|uniref:OLC1v1024392C1 n=1 Tax=Oldenlandia corymbosa var. corymbosa TaxID=529605 RepID=A0AAV1C2B9_OLDCO|nr:OLC1v1024392C1 [Oldenlandia corymbosa var. corymbosa]